MSSVRVSVLVCWDVRMLGRKFNAEIYRGADLHPRISWENSHLITLTYADRPRQDVIFFIVRKKNILTFWSNISSYQSLFVWLYFDFLFFSSVSVLVLCVDGGHPYCLDPGGAVQRCPGGHAPRPLLPVLHQRTGTCRFLQFTFCLPIL